MLKQVSINRKFAACDQRVGIFQCLADGLQLGRDDLYLDIGRMTQYGKPFVGQVGRDDDFIWVQ